MNVAEIFPKHFFIQDNVSSGFEKFKVVVL